MESRPKRDRRAPKRLDDEQDDIKQFNSYYSSSQSPPASSEPLPQALASPASSDLTELSSSPPPEEQHAPVSEPFPTPIEPLPTPFATKKQPPAQKTALAPEPPVHSSTPSAPHSPPRKRLKHNPKPPKQASSSIPHSASISSLLGPQSAPSTPAPTSSPAVKQGLGGPGSNTPQGLKRPGVVGSSVRKQPPPPTTSFFGGIGSLLGSSSSTPIPKVPLKPKTVPKVEAKMEPALTAEERQAKIRKQRDEERAALAKSATQGFDLLEQSLGMKEFEDDIRQHVRAVAKADSEMSKTEHEAVVPLPRLSSFGSVFSLFPRLDVSNRAGELKSESKMAVDGC